MASRNEEHERKGHLWGETFLPTHLGLFACQIGHSSLLTKCLTQANKCLQPKLFHANNITIRRKHQSSYLGIYHPLSF